MADLQFDRSGSKRKSKRHVTGKRSTRVDLTPMVDLGFLLITFFIFTTRLSEAKTMHLFLPANGSGTVTGESTAITVFPLKDKIFYYLGSLDNALQKHQYGFTNYSVSAGIGNIIRQRQAALEKTAPGMSKELTLMIKPADGADYKNFVDVMDQVLINDVKRYALMDISGQEKHSLETIVPGL